MGQIEYLIDNAFIYPLEEPVILKTIELRQFI